MIEPARNVTVLNGQNGQGKTNLLEGIFLFAGGRSFRTVHESELVRFGEDFGEVSMVYESGGREMEVMLRFVPKTGKRFCRRNGVPLTKMSEMVGDFRAVLFCPEHLAIVREGPSLRRRFLDTAISQVDPKYLRALQIYTHALNQRNALIKMAKDRRNDGLFYQNAELFSEQMAEQGETISKARQEYVERLDKTAGRFLSDMTAGRETMRLVYQTPRTKEDYRRLLSENLDRELRAGATLYGVHKDDVAVFLNEKEARAYGSQGQQRSIALSMKLAEGELSRESTKEYPVFLFDDILSELDESRKSYLLSGLGDRQVLITSCEAVTAEGKIYQIKNGEVFHPVM